MTERRYRILNEWIEQAEECALKKGHFSAYGTSLRRDLWSDIPAGEAASIEESLIEKVVRPILKQAFSASTFCDPSHFFEHPSSFARKRTTWTFSDNMLSLLNERGFWTERLANAPRRGPVAIVCRPSEELVRQIAQSLFDPTVTVNLLSFYTTAEKAFLKKQAQEGKLTVVIENGGLSKFTLFPPPSMIRSLTRILCENAQISFEMK